MVKRLNYFILKMNIFSCEKIAYCPYGLFVMIPLTILIRNLNYFFPELDEEKGNLEIFVEALGQLGITFVIILLVHRIITYFTPIRKIRRT